MIENQNSIIIKRLKRRFKEIKKLKSKREMTTFECTLNQYMKEPTQENRALNDTVKILRGECFYFLQRLYQGVK